MKCPSCKDITLSLSERAGIEIDYCPECRGVWLDRGELDKILEKSKEENPINQPRPSHQGHPSHSHEHYQKPYKRKKSFLEEIFD